MFQGLHSIQRVSLGCTKYDAAKRFSYSKQFMQTFVLQVTNTVEAWGQG